MAQKAAAILPEKVTPRVGLTFCKNCEAGRMYLRFGFVLQILPTAIDLNVR